MLHHCTGIILSEVNHYIQLKLGLKKKEIPVSFASLGNAATESKSIHGILMRLVDIVGVEWCASNEYVPKGDGFMVRKRPEAFSLYFLFSIDYKVSDYLKNLELLTCVAAFFQHKPHFDSCNTPVLQEVGMDNFSVELVKMTMSERSMFWTSLHLPYSPSLLYKVGLVSIEDGMDPQVVSAVYSIER